VDQGASIDRDEDAIDVPRRGRREEQREAGQVPRRAYPTHWLCGCDRITSILEPEGAHLGWEDARHNGIDGDVLLGKRNGHKLREMVGSRFGCIVAPKSVAFRSQTRI